MSNPVITLRKAAKFRNRLEGRMNELKALVLAHTYIAVNIYDPNITEQLDIASAAFDARIARFQMISAALVSVRAAIGKANAQAGINDLLTQRIALMGQASVYRAIANITDMRLNTAVLNARMEGYKAQEDQYGRNGTQNVAILSSEQVASAKSEADAITSQLDDITDELETANSSAVVLQDAVWAVLQTEKLI